MENTLVIDFEEFVQSSVELLLGKAVSVLQYLYVCVLWVTEGVVQLNECVCGVCV